MLAWQHIPHNLPVIDALTPAMRGCHREEAYRLFRQLIEDPKRWLRFTAQAGEVTLFDNERVMHGRGEFTGHREFTGSYFHTDATRSTLRRLLAAGVEPPASG